MDTNLTPATKHNRIEMAAIFVMGILLRLPFMSATVDDAFITFRYVRNIISGNGFVFNVGERVLGTTTPFYTLYMALWGSLGLDFITIGKLTNIAADAASAVLLFVLIRRVTNRGVAWTAVLLILCSPYNLQYSASGMETGIYTFIIMLIFYLYAQERFYALAVLGGLLILVRPDGVLALTAVALMWLLERRGLKAGLKYALLAAVVALPWLLFATWYFGSPIPHSVAAKSLTYRSSLPLYWLRILWFVFAQRGGAGGAILIFALLATGGLSVFLRNALRPLRLHLLWLIIYIGIFTFFQSGRFGWYYAPIMPLLFLFVVLGGYEWFRQSQRLPAMTTIMRSKLRYILAAAFIAVLIPALGTAVYGAWQEAHKEVVSEEVVWRPLSQWIKENSTPEAAVSLESIGAIGWYTERYIWDEGGLISAKVYALNQETPGNINVIGLLQTYHPDFYIAWDPWELNARFPAPEDKAWFAANYAEVGKYTGSGKTWTLFRLRDR